MYHWTTKQTKEHLMSWNLKKHLMSSNLKAHTMFWNYNSDGIKAKKYP